VADVAVELSDGSEAIHLRIAAAPALATLPAPSPPPWTAVKKVG
jgi:hypothetical protein